MKQIKKMKKFNYLIAVFLMASGLFITSCETDPATTPPTILFNASPGYTTGDVSVSAGSVLQIGIIANGTSANLSRFKITQTANSQTSTLLDSTISAAQFSQNFTITAAPVAGVVKLTFSVSQSDGESTELSITITTTAPVAGPIKNYIQKILGSYDNITYGSSFASSDGTVYTLSEAKTNAAKVDWMYYYGTTNLATLASPKDATVSTIYSGSNGPASWTVRNDTRFAIVVLPTGVTWDNITTDAEIIPLASGATATSVSSLTAGKIVSFKTASGKMGLIKVEAITGTGAGSITYSVKVQQ